MRAVHAFKEVSNVLPAGEDARDTISAITQPHALMTTPVICFEDQISSIHSRQGLRQNEAIKLSNW